MLVIEKEIKLVDYLESIVAAIKEKLDTHGLIVLNSDDQEKNI